MRVRRDPEAQIDRPLMPRKSIAEIRTDLRPLESVVKAQLKLPKKTALELAAAARVPDGQRQEFCELLPRFFELCGWRQEHVNKRTNKAPHSWRASVNLGGF